MRRDRLGRRIGRNWWREMNVDQWSSAMAAWDAECEVAAMGYATETAEFAAANPRPQYKDFLVSNAGQYADRAA